MDLWYRDTGVGAAINIIKEKCFYIHNYKVNIKEKGKSLYLWTTKRNKIL